MTFQNILKYKLIILKITKPYTEEKGHFIFHINRFHIDNLLGFHFALEKEIIQQFKTFIHYKSFGESESEELKLLTYFPLFLYNKELSKK